MCRARKPSGGSFVKASAKPVKSVSSRDAKLISASEAGRTCPKCTFVNHKDLRFCEVCDSTLLATIAEPGQGGAAGSAPAKPVQAVKEIPKPKSPPTAEEKALAKAIELSLCEAKERQSERDRVVRLQKAEIKMDGGPGQHSSVPIVPDNYIVDSKADAKCSGCDCKSAGVVLPCAHSTCVRCLCAEGSRAMTELRTPVCPEKKCSASLPVDLCSSLFGPAATEKLFLEYRRPCAPRVVSACPSDGAVTIEVRVKLSLEAPLESVEVGIGPGGTAPPLKYKCHHVDMRPAQRSLTALHGSRVLRVRIEGLRNGSEYVFKATCSNALGSSSATTRATPANHPEAFAAAAKLRRRIDATVGAASASKFDASTGQFRLAPPAFHVASDSQVAEQARLGAQSLRGNTWHGTTWHPSEADKYFKNPSPYGQGSTAKPTKSDKAHAKRCIRGMIGREKALCGRYAVFYHAYSDAALLYETIGALGSVLFGYDTSHAPLPRLQLGPFAQVPDARRLFALYLTRNSDQTAHFKSVGISTSLSVRGESCYASPAQTLLHGYNCTPVDGVLHKFLESAGLLKCKSEILRLATKHRVRSAPHEVQTLVHATGMGGGVGIAKPSEGLARCRGQILQIFIRHELVDRLSYSSMSLGHFEFRRHPIGRYLRRDFDCKKWVPGKKPKMPWGGVTVQDCGAAAENFVFEQARVLCHPSAFLDSNCVKMFNYSGDEKYHNQRASFSRELQTLLRKSLHNSAQRARALEGLLGGDTGAGVVSITKNALDKAKTLYGSPKDIYADGKTVYIGSEAKMSVATTLASPPEAAGAKGNGAGDAKVRPGSAVMDVVEESESENGRNGCVDASTAKRLGALKKKPPADESGRKGGWLLSSAMRLFGVSRSS